VCVQVVCLYLFGVCQKFFKCQELRTNYPTKNKKYHTTPLMIRLRSLFAHFPLTSSSFSQSSRSFSVPISQLSEKFKTKFNIQYHKPVPAKQLIKFVNPVNTKYSVEERTLEFELRDVDLWETQLGSKGSQRLRAGGYLPCCVYGGGPTDFNPSIELTIPTKEIATQVRRYGSRLENTIFKLKIKEFPNQSVYVVARQLTTHPVSDEIISLNFLRLSGKNANKKKYKHQLNVDIPIEYMDHDLSPAVKRGGFVNRTRWKLPCTVNPNDLIDTGIEGVLVTEDEGYDVTTGMTTSDLKLKDEIPQMFEVSLAGFEGKKKKIGLVVYNCYCCCCFCCFCCSSTNFFFSFSIFVVVFIFDSQRSYSCLKFSDACGY
jgi:large subunit ribosomal protein L25